MAKQDGYSLIFISRRLRSWFRPKKRTFIPAQASSLSWKRPKRGNPRKRPLWRFFRPRHVLGYKPPLPTSNLTGGGSYLLPFISRRLRIFGRPRHVLPPTPPSPTITTIQRKRFRIKRVSWIVNVARFAILGPPPELIKKPRPPLRFRQKRPLWRFFRPRHLISLPPPPPPVSILTGGGSYALPYVSRRLRSFYRPSLRRLPQPNPRVLVNKRPQVRFWQRRRLPRVFFRPHHLNATWPPPTPPLLQGAAGYALAYISRRLRIFGRPRHILPATPPVRTFRQFRPPLRFKQKRPLWRFFRPRHILGFNPPPATSFFPRKPGPRPRIKRARWNVLMLKRRLLYFEVTPPTPPTAAEWIVRYRRRGRR